MANILVYIHLEDGDASGASLATLNQGRRVANRLGAALYAMLPCKTPPSYDEDDIITVISRHGADKVILVTNPGLDLPPPPEVLGPVLATACKRFPPRLVLLPAVGDLQDLGDDLASAIKGSFVSVLSSAEDDPAAADGDSLSDELLLDNPEPLVVMIHDVSAPEIMGDDDTEVVVFQAPLDSPASGEAAKKEA